MLMLARVPFVYGLSRLVTSSMVFKALLVSLLGLGTTAMDVLGILLLLPLIRILSDTSTEYSIPFLGVVSAGGLVALIVLFFVSKTILSAAARWWISGTVATANAKTATALFDVYMRAPLEFHDHHNSSSLINSLTQTLDRVFTRGFLGLSMAVMEGTTIFVVGMTLLVIAPVPGLGAILYFGIAALVFLRFVSRKVRSLASQAELDGAKTISVAREGLRGIRERRVRRTEFVSVEEFRSCRSRSTVDQKTIIYLAEAPRYYLDASFAIGFGVLALLAVGLGNQDDVLPTLALALGAGFRVLPSLARLLSSLTSIKAGSTAMSPLLANLDQLGIQDLRNVTPDLPTTLNAEICSAGRTEVILENVTYGYPGKAPCIENLSLRVPAGSSLAITGGSGSGKSTLLDILCGLRAPSSGVAHLRTENWPTVVGYVPQQVQLVDGTISDNVTFGSKTDKNKVHAALAGACLLEYVLSLPDKAETPVGEGGGRLSGGQRQRLGIARALYVHPTVMFLDEATSALDVDTEEEVIQSLLASRDRPTVVLVTHRDSVANACDHRLILDTN